ncbi:MAG: hypothetical protein J7619_18130 [Dyadobacter sp.]|uniref:hypothetical protein n=1 Tax=Dyadobacter sp. TaxID=1914288 RepID=UPI001B2F3B01|nr:hypothetical protein [Dyadobacter sp.]MBO9614624.1 hypothetical protein [Dyadobacter sp.]
MHINPTYLTKLKRIVIPFVIAAWGTLLLLAFIRWWLFLGKFPIMELDEDMWQYWIPVVAPWIPILIWLKPRFNQLEYKAGTDKGSWQMQVIAWVGMAPMLIFSQFLLTTATAQVREVKNVKEIRKHEVVRYYRINEFAVHRFIGGVHYSFRTLGRFNQDLHMDIYFVNPILTHKKQAITMTPLYWYGVNFQ